MKHLQAIVLLSTKDEIEDKLSSFFENVCNIYSYEIYKQTEIVSAIYNEGSIRESIFTKLDEALVNNPTAKVIIISEQSVSGVDKLANFDSVKDVASQHELFLRHTVSIIHAKYKDTVVEVYTYDNSLDDPFKKII